MRWGAAFFGLWVACAAEPMTDDAGSASPDLGHLEPEAGVTDAFEDAEISDAGEIDAEDARVDDADSTPHDAGPDAAFEPCGPPGGACERAADCQPDLPPPTNCETCVRYNRSLCASGACRAPPILDGTDLYNVVVTLAPGLPPLESFSTFAIAAATAGGAPLRCPSVPSGKFGSRSRSSFSPLLDARPAAALSGSSVIGGNPTPSGARRSATKNPSREHDRTSRTGH
jgi:hypothetical protein